MDIRESVVNGSPLLILSGQLDFSSRLAVLKMLEKQAQTPWQRMLIDVQDVTFVDSAGLGVLALAAKRVQDVKREVLIVNPRGQLRSRLEEISLSALTPVVDSNSEYSTFTNIP